jgi:hypothetical protein
MISLNAPAFLDLNKSRQIETEVEEDSAVDFSNHQLWNPEGGWKNTLNNLTSHSPTALYSLVDSPWLDIFLLFRFNYPGSSLN